MLRSEKPGWRGVPLYARRGGLLEWDGAIGVDAARYEFGWRRVIPRGHLFNRGAASLSPGFSPLMRGNCFCSGATLRMMVGRTRR